jgi:hypothetical protein
LKAFVFALGGWRFLLLEKLKVLTFIFDVKGYCFYSWMFKVFTFGFRCWKFLFLFLDIEGFYFFSWMLKVFALTFKCWRFFFGCTSKLHIQGNIFSKVPKIVIQFTWL